MFGQSNSRKRRTIKPEGVTLKFNITGVEASSIAVDWIGNNLYWIDAGSQTIKMSDLNGKNIRKLATGKLQGPQSIVLDPENG